MTPIDHIRDLARRALALAEGISVAPSQIMLAAAAMTFVREAEVLYPAAVERERKGRLP